MKWFLLSFIFSLNVWAQDPVALFRSHFPAQQLGPLNQQAFCWESANGAGNYRGTSPQRLASVTKLFTTALALESFGPEKTWTTTVYRLGTKVHIAGGMDPWFEEEKIFSLIQALKDLGVTQISELTFDGAFVFTDTSQSQHTPATFTLTQAALARYFSASGNFAAYATGRRAAAAAFQNEEGVSAPLPTKGIATAKITPAHSNPLANLPGVTVHRHTSKPLVTILKAMNIMSKNMVAHMLWENSRRMKNPADVFSKMGIAPSEYNFISGSGLPLINGQNRTDNVATCAAVLKLLTALESQLNKLGLEINQVVGVGTDFGSYRDRFLNDLALKEAVAAKTGTLRHSSALAGWIEAEVPVRFAILNHTTATTNARSWQDRFLSRWMNGQSRPRGYIRESVYPVDTNFFN
jgi:D-alanyl-D-alanine carboxypeptidase/D-alanyl-D-alanine-endopeptidase (penicillin-binding protein 4)